MASGSYTKVGPWVNGAAPALSAANLDQVETQFEEAAYVPGARMIPPVVRWVMPGWASDDNEDAVAVANRIYYMPIYIPESVSYDRIGIYVRVGDGAGGLADLRIFDWGSGVPTDLVLSAGTVSTNAAGAKEIVIAETLAGLYFLAVRCDQTPTMSGIDHQYFSTFITGLTSTNQQTCPGYGVLYDDAAYSDPAGTVDGISPANFAVVKLREA